MDGGFEMDVAHGVDLRREPTRLRAEWRRSAAETSASWRGTGLVGPRGHAAVRDAPGDGGLEIKTETELQPVASSKLDV